MNHFTLEGRKNNECSERFHFIGKQVKHSVNDDSVEYGIIVNAWYEPSIDSIDCYVAFYESPTEIGTAQAKPTVLRYALSSLELIEPCWKVIRQDDHGNRYLFKTCNSEKDAEVCAQQQNDKGHHQGYWVEKG